jgi:hypothetical protein
MPSEADTLTRRPVTIQAVTPDADFHRHRHHRKSR